jgi:primosomal replication protein N
MKKMLTYLIPIVLLVAIGCTTESTEKATRGDATPAKRGTSLEEKYGAETIAMLEGVIPNWRDRLREVEKARKEWKDSPMKVLTEKETFMETDMTRGYYISVQGSLASSERMQERVARCKARGMGIDQARTHVRSLYHLSPHPGSLPGTEECIDSMIIAVYIFNVSSEEVRQSAIIGRHYLLKHEQEGFKRAGL